MSRSASPSESDCFEKCDQQQQKIAELEQSLADCRQQLASYQHSADSQTLAAATSDRYISFFQNLSHELLTPMNSIKGLVELGLEVDASPRVTNYLRQMKSSCRQLNFIIDELLMIVTLAKGEYQLQQQAFKITDMVNSVVTDYISDISRKKLALSLALPSDLNHDIVGDAYAISKILQYLLDNAVKFTETGSIGLHVERVSSATGSAQLQICVEDTGTGIAKDYQQKIFEPFFQVDGSMTRKYSGVGLGLAISQQMVELLGGELHLESEPGRGTKVSFGVDYQDFSSPLPTSSGSTVDDGSGPNGENLCADVLRASFQRILSKLQSALMEGDYCQAEQALAAITAAMKALVPGADFNALQQHIVDFDFDDALSCIGSITAELSQHQEMSNHT